MGLVFYKRHLKFFPQKLLPPQLEPLEQLEQLEPQLELEQLELQLEPLEELDTTVLEAIVL
jgi:hypothetical protein